MVPARPLDAEFVPAGDRSFVRAGERLLRRAVAQGAQLDAAAFERRLRRQFPYAAVIVARLSVGPGAAAAAGVAWRIYRDGGRTQSLW
jgi:hypothetical protein